MDKFKQNETMDDVIEYGFKGHYSMAPLFHADDTVLIRKVDIKEIGVGDILIFKRPRGIFAHRCVACLKENNETCFRTKGDNVAVIDPWCITENIMLGKVIQIKRGDRVIDLENIFWKFKGRYIAFLSFLQANITANLKRSKKWPKVRSYSFLIYKFLIYLVARG